MKCVQGVRIIAGYERDTLVCDAFTRAKSSREKSETAKREKFLVEEYHGHVIVIAIDICNINGIGESDLDCIFIGEKFHCRGFVISNV